MSNPSSTSDTILASARTFILMGGYNGFSYADIAEVVGIRKASIHHHFPSKVDLVRSLLQRHREGTQAITAELEASNADPLDLLTAYAGMWSRCIEDASLPFCVCALLAAELPALPPELAVEVRAYFQSLSSWLTGVMERGADLGRLRLESPAKLEAESFMATIHGAMLSARANGSPALFGAVMAPVLRRLATTAH